MLTHSICNATHKNHLVLLCCYQNVAGYLGKKQEFVLINHQGQFVPELWGKQEMCTVSYPKYFFINTCPIVTYTAKSPPQYWNTQNVDLTLSEFICVELDIYKDCRVLSQHMGFCCAFKL